jgi:hypothetical protein
MPAIPSLMTASSTTGAQIEEVKEIRSEDYLPITDPKNVEKFVNDYFADIPVMAEIARCESTYRHYTSNGQVLRGVENNSDRGVMQINLWYHEETAKELGLDLHKIDDNVAYARYLYEKQGAKPWMASSPCWAKFSQTEIARK